MTTTIQNLDDLQDRRIMMDRDVPPYGYAFVILVGLFMIFLLVWSTRTNRIYVSQNSGTVQASNKTYIMSSYSGTLTELYISEGSYVNEGDLVAHIKSTDLDMQQDNLESQLKIYQTQVDQYNKLLQCIQDDTNYFSETSVEDQPYYYQYETYKSQVEQKTFDASAYQAAGYSDAPETGETFSAARRIAGIYARMAPEDAARIIGTMKTGQIVRLLKLMRPEDASAVLARLPLAKAREVTERMLERPAL